MKLNPDLIRDILIAASKVLEPDNDGFVSQISPVDLAETELAEYPRNEVLYWIRQLMDSGIIISGSKYVDEPIANIKDLSISGYQIIESTSSSSIWNEVRSQLIGLAVSNLPTFIQKAIELGSSLSANCPNIHL